MSIEWVAAPNLKAGDVVLLDGQHVTLLTEALTFHRGLSLFDAFELRIGALVRLPSGWTKTVTWRVDEHVAAVTVDERGDPG